MVIVILFGIAAVYVALCVGAANLLYRYMEPRWDRQFHDTYHSRYGYPDDPSLHPHCRWCKVRR